MSNSCIRVLADPVQIKDCKEAIEIIESDLNSLTKFYSLAGTPTRMKILFLLHREGKMCPCDLSDVLGISVPAVSQHLRKLKDGGLVFDNKVGQTIFYSLESDKTDLFLSVIEELMLKTTKEELNESR